MAELDDDTAEGLAAHLWLTNPPEPVGAVDDDFDPCCPGGGGGVIDRPVYVVGET